MKIKKCYINKNGGQALLLGVVLFLFLSVTAVTGLSGSILRQANIMDDFMTSRKSYFLTESGIEDAVYRIKNNKQIGTSNSLTLNGSTVNVTVTDTASTKTIDAVSGVNNLVRNVKTVMKMGTGSSFNYGIQSGAGGFVLGSNATVNGSVYANGSITGSSGSKITGAAFSANGPALTANQTNDFPPTPASSIRFGDTNSTADLGQGFKVSVSENLAKISLYIKKTSTPSNLMVRITTDNAGSPSVNTLVSATRQRRTISACIKARLSSKSTSRHYKKNRKSTSRQKWPRLRITRRAF